MTRKIECQEERFYLHQDWLEQSPFQEQALLDHNQRFTKKTELWLKPSLRLS
ncbi:MAG: hypothetical protein ACI97P_002965 [Arcticibacterium sp.]|jgi:hypothetical protein